MKKTIINVLITIIIVIALAVLGSSLFTVEENEYACIFRFSEIVNTVSTSGLHFKIPFIDSVKKFPKEIQLYDIPPSEVLTSDKKNMTVDSYVMWKISDPETFYKALGSIDIAENRLDAITYNALKNAMGVLEQNAIINQEDASERNDIYGAITQNVAELATTYGIEVIDVKVKRLDLPSDNEQAVYQRMISERNQIAEKYTADGEKEAAVIRNDVDKQVNIIISDAQAQAAAIEAEGESEYMKILADAYNTDEKKDFYEFTLALEALQASLTGDEKVVVLGPDSALAKLLMGEK